LFEYRGKILPRPPEHLIRILGLPFKPTLRIEEALTHRSASHERGRKTPIPNYERLEFLGDRVIGLIVSEYLLNTWPNASEGDIGQIFSGIVSTQTLANIARRMDLGAYMILGKGSHSSGDRENPSLLADTFEALAASLYLEYGLETVRQVLIPWFAQPLFEQVSQLEIQRELRENAAPPAPAPHQASRRNGNLNYKLLLQKWSQSRYGELPDYRVLDEFGPPHQRRFRMGVFVQGTLLGEGESTTKRGASITAARKAWEKIQAEPSLPPLESTDDASESADIRDITGEISHENPMNVGLNGEGMGVEPILEEPFSHGVGLESLESSAVVVNEQEMPVSETVGTEGEAKGE
jgi:ribonuclease-3